MSANITEFTLDKSQQIIIIKRDNTERVYGYTSRRAALLLFAGRNKGLNELYADETEGAGWYGHPRFCIWKRYEAEGKLLSATRAASLARKGEREDNSPRRGPGETW